MRLRWANWSEMKSGWFRRLIPPPRDHRTKTTEQSGAPANGDDEALGVTPELIEFVRTFTVDTFKDFRRGDEEENGGYDASGSPIAHLRRELSDWQTKHATLVLSKVKEISNLRYILCPRHLKEHVFWEIYFRHVQSYVKKYEQHAIRQEQIKKIMMERENKAQRDNGIEVEMAETKRECSSSSSIPQD